MNHPQRPGIEVRRLSMAEIDQPFVSEWLALEARAIEPNAYMSPHFVLPALRHLRPATLPIFVAIYGNPGTGTRLLGLGIFTAEGPTRRFPLPHLRSYRCVHSYVTGPLIDPEAAESAVDALFDFVDKPGSPWHGLVFDNRNAEGPLAAALDAAASRRGITWVGLETFSQAILYPARIDDQYLDRVMSRKRQKKLQRAYRQLAETGAVSWHVIDGREVSAETVETFLELENSGWKKENGSSLRCRPAHEAFFTEMCTGFAQDGRALFTELRVDGRAIASTSNFLSGAAAFAFKLGWDPDFAKYAPGVLNEYLLVRHARERLGSLSYIDSGTDEGSFIEMLWADKTPIATGFYATSRLARILIPFWMRLRGLWRRFRRRPTASSRAAASGSDETAPGAVDREGPDA